MNPSSNAAPVKEVVLVCGMHRSGTSAFTRVCNLLGAALPEPLVEPAVGNELGLWEPAEVVAMNDRALLAASSDVNSVFPISPVWLQSPAAEHFTAEVEGYVTGLGEELKTWVVKDPRISILSGLWSAGVARSGVRPRFIIAFRNPWEVAMSLRTRQLHHFPDEVWPLERGLALWLNYMLTVERQSRGFPRSFVGYEGFLGDWRGEVARVYAQLGLDKPDGDEASERAIDDFVRPGERHARHDAAETSVSGGLALQVYAALHSKVADPEAAQEVFDDAAAKFVASFDILGGYLGALERRARDLTMLKTRTANAEAEADELKKAVEAARLHAIHLARTAASSQTDSSGETADRPSAPDHLQQLQKKHDALIVAHRQNLEAYRAERAARGDALDRQQQAFAARLAEKEQAFVAKLAEKDEALASSLAEKQATFASSLTERDAIIAKLEEVMGRPVPSLQGLIDANAELDLMRNSTSWRITQPLRAVVTMLRRR